MALDPRIALAGVVPSNATAINIFENALTNAQNRGIKSAQEARAAELQPLAMQQQQQTVDANAQTLAANRDKQRIINLNQTGQRLKPFLVNNDVQGATNFVLKNISNLQDRIEAGEDLDLTESFETLRNLQEGNVQQVADDIGAVEQMYKQQLGINASAGQREFQNLLTMAQDPNATQLERDSAQRALGNMANVGISAQERIATDPTLGTQVVEQVAAETSASEGSKLIQQKKHKPVIAALVKLAEKEAVERGDTLTALQRSQAALPGLKDAVGQLRELSSLATSTWGGSVFDVAVKQTGFGSTKGATAKAKFIAIVNNQVLPLLKETFGAAFTATEGESLKATMGDPDASPDAKMAQLDAFIDQKMRDIETKKTQLDLSKDSLNKLTNVSDDELFN